MITILVLRESGLIFFHYAKSQFDNKMQIDLHSDFMAEKDGTQFPSTERKKIDSQQPIIAEIAWNIGFNTSPQVNIFTNIEEPVKKNLEKAKSLDIKFQSIKLSGLYWLPFYKNGSCKYAFDVEITGENSRFYRGTGNGEIEFSAYGIMSATEIKEKISEQIAADLALTLKRETK